MINYDKGMAHVKLNVIFRTLITYFMFCSLNYTANTVIVNADIYIIVNLSNKLF